MSLTGIVLAAGMSSRMGIYKPLITIGGESMARRVVRMMLGAGADRVIVVTGYHGDQLTAHLADLPVRCVENPAYASSDMLTSLRVVLALPDIVCDRLMICPVDVPLVSAELARRLAEAPGAFVRPVWQGKGGHPVVMDGALIPAIQAYGGTDGLRGVIRSAGIAITPMIVEDRAVVLDSDTPAELEELLRWYRKTT